MEARQWPAPHHHRQADREPRGGTGGVGPAPCISLLAEAVPEWRACVDQAGPRRCSPRLATRRLSLGLETCLTSQVTFVKGAITCAQEDGPDGWSLHRLR